MTKWRNGGGYTRELATGAGSGAAVPGADAFGWRLSIADLTQTALFSPFTGVDRQFLLLSAAPLRLDIDGVDHRVQSRQMVPFPGEARVAALPATGGGRALNLMTRRGLFTGDIRVVEHSGPTCWDDPDLVAVVVLGGTLTPSSGRLAGRYDSLHWNDSSRGIRCTAYCAAVTVAEVRIRASTPQATVPQY